MNSREATSILILLLFSASLFSQQAKKQEKTNQIKEATVTYTRKTPVAETKPVATSNVAPEAKNIVAPSAPKPIEKKEPKPDTIIKLGGRKLICNIQKVNQNTITYTKPSETSVQEILKKEIERIIWRNGRKETLSKPVFAMVDKTQWESVIVTDIEAEVDGLYKKAAIKATASSGSRSPKAAKLSATIRLQKKAANLGGQFVLITHSEMQGGYGEIPGWVLEGIAYSDTPPADTASVNKAIRVMLERSRARKGKR